MSFWDSCAIIPLLVEEEFSATAHRIFAEDRVMVVWWGTSVECTSARTGEISHDEEREVREKLDAAAESWSEMEPSSEVRNTARLLLRRHPLSAADSLQLAAALVWCENKPQGAVFVCLDQRLRDAADAEGFAVSPSAAEFTAITEKKYAFGGGQDDKKLG